MKLSNINDLKEEGTSHDKNIKKKMFLQKGDIPNLMMFGSATFKSGQKVETHKHETMSEIFYIDKGNIDFEVENKKIQLKAGDCITIEAGENHSQYNPYNEDATVLYFGIEVK